MQLCNLWTCITDKKSEKWTNRNVGRKSVFFSGVCGVQSVVNVVRNIWLNNLVLFMYRHLRHTDFAHAHADQESTCVSLTHINDYLENLPCKIRRNVTEISKFTLVRYPLKNKGSYLPFPCLKSASISSKVLFFVSGTFLYVNIQNIARNTLNGRKV